MVIDIPFRASGSCSLCGGRITGVTARRSEIEAGSVLVKCKHCGVCQAPVWDPFPVAPVQVVFSTAFVACPPREIKGLGGKVK